jgi:hypothetical protein
MINLSSTALEGKEALTTITGCEKPCESIDYNAIPLASWKMENNRDPRANQLLDSNSSSFIMVTHVPKPTIKILEEKPRYTAITFISDVGGILGVFLGISFWSVYQIIIFPLVDKLQRVLLTADKLLF